MIILLGQHIPHMTVLLEYIDVFLGLAKLIYSLLSLPTWNFKNVAIFSFLNIYHAFLLFVTVFLCSSLTNTAYITVVCDICIADAHA